MDNKDYTYTADSTPLKCKRCGRQFSPDLLIEGIAGINQLHAGRLMITRLEGACIHCGSINYWNFKEKEIEKIARVYGEIIEAIRLYNPE